MQPDEEEMADERLMQALRQLDHPIPRVDAETIAARARRLDLRGNVARAAGILLVLGLVGGVAYATPDSGLRRWIRSLMGWSASDSVPEPQVAVPEVPTSGIAVDPGASLQIQFTTRSPGARVRVSLIDGPEAVVRAPAGAAAFTADVGRVVVSNRDSTAVFDVMIPRIAPQVEIRVTGTVIFTKERSRVLVGGRTPGPGPWLLPISPD